MPGIHACPVRPHRQSVYSRVKDVRLAAHELADTHGMNEVRVVHVLVHVLVHVGDAKLLVAHILGVANRSCSYVKRLRCFCQVLAAGVGGEFGKTKRKKNPQVPGF